MVGSLQHAVDELYRIAVVEGRATSTLRLSALADHCVEQLKSRGLADVRAEATLPGAGRPKCWDVAWFYDGKVRLAISLKSLLRNLAGTVPNRIDDLMGEVANLQLYSPEVVIGYLMLFDVQADSLRGSDGLRWSEYMEQRLGALAERRPPVWTIGTVEAVAFVRLDFSAGPQLRSPASVTDLFFDQLVAQALARNPGYTPQSPSEA
ncbi:MAG: hypothetical protein HUU35_06225 [Armatimonadetes bacterium]|nr:hypothetical protein [Armatimonadota bacterium]